MSGVKQLREMFPILDSEIYGKKLVYLDNAATSQKPLSVLELQSDICSHFNANVHRAVHQLSSSATDLYEKGREEVRHFIGASSREEIIFTSGATAAFNLLAYSFSKAFLKKGDRILVSLSEHHSNIVPWQFVSENIGVSLEVIPLNEQGFIDINALTSMIDDRVKLISITHISNVLGVINPIEQIVDIAHNQGIPVAIDGSQGIVHSPVDVKSIDCDFYIFSGHKIFTPTGTGILYGKKKYLDRMPPFFGGGDMVDRVTFEKTTYAELPLKFEAGTPNYIAASCFAPALKIASQIRKDEEIMNSERHIVNFLLEELQKIDGLKLYGCPSDSSKKIPLFSITIEGTHPMDIAMLLDKMGVEVRSGLMCAEPLIRKYSDKGMLRASFMPYNTLEEAEYFVKCLRRALTMLK